MSVLKGLFGVKGCPGLNEPLSGKYINRRGGISTEMFESLAKDDQASFLDVYDDIESRAIDDFKNAVTNRMQKFFKVVPVEESVNTGTYKDERTLIPTDTVLKGGYIHTWQDPLLNVKVNSLKLYSNEAVEAVDFYIYDIDNGILLDTFQRDLIKGYNTIQVQKEYIVYAENKRLGIFYDGEKVTSLQTVNEEDSAQSDWFNGEVEKGDQVIKDNINTDVDPGGLVVNYSLICSIDNLICGRLSMFETAFELKLASEVMFERISSDRINNYTTFDFEKAKQLHEDYDKASMQILDDQLKESVFHESDVCFMCARDVQSRQILP